MSRILIFFKLLILDSGIIAFHKLNWCWKWNFIYQLKYIYYCYLQYLSLVFKNELRAEQYYDTKITQSELEDMHQDIFACFENSSLPK